MQKSYSWMPGTLIFRKQYDKNFSGTVDKNWYLFDNKLYQYPYQIPGYSKWLKQKEEKQQRVIKDGLIVTGGIVAIVATGGAATPAILGAEGFTGGGAIMVPSAQLLQILLLAVRACFNHVIYQAYFYIFFRLL